MHGSGVKFRKFLDFVPIHTLRKPSEADQKKLTVILRMGVWPGVLAAVSRGQPVERRSGTQ